MSTNVNKTWHLSAETRFILVRLRDAIQQNLTLDELGCSSGDFTGYWSLFPWIYKAFTKIWCRKIPFCVRKKSYTRVSIGDIPMVLIDKATFERFRSAYYCELNRERAIPCKNGFLYPSMVDAVPGSKVDDLPF